MPQILIIDKQGTPKDWVSLQTAACYYALDKVVWETGNNIFKFRGGINKKGERSCIDIHSILGVRGPLLGDSFYSKESIYTNRGILYTRDRNMCAYCGDVFDYKNLTIDHVIPRSKGGGNTWINCVTACKYCNHIKGGRTPEEAKMQLLYVPYAVNKFEKMILSNRKILADQMEFLLSKVPKYSRIRL